MPAALGFLFALLCTFAEARAQDASFLPRSIADEETNPPFLPFLDQEPRPPLDQDSKSQTPPPPAQEPRIFPPPHHSVSDFADTHFSALAWRAFVWDDYLTSAEVLIPASLVVGAIAIHPWDKQILAKWEGLLGGHQTYSNVSNYILIGTAIGTGVLFPGEGRNWWDQAWSMGESYGSSALTVFTLKTTVQRPRPGSTPTSGNGTHSFPSGHSASAFGSATLIQRNSGWLAGAPAYGLAAFTAFERVESGRHFPSDVFAGAAIGSLSSGIFDSLHWGAGEGRGIARALSHVELGVDDHFHSGSVGFAFRF